MKRSARTLVLFTGLVVCGSVPAAAFEIASQSHHLDRFRLEPAEPLVIRFDRSLARASVASDSMTASSPPTLWLVMHALVPLRPYLMPI